jgi:general secretion pathway protein A
MYNDYFRFKQKPFSIAPDPGFLYLSERHREALAHLMYGLTTDGGFVLITGEVGTGKTTLIRSLIDRVPADLDVAFILNPRLTVQELLETLCDELGVPYTREHARTVKHYLDGLTKHLLRTHSLGRSTVMIIDEAQNLSPPVLEQIRLLTNLETNERKLLRIILLGQPELADMLDRKELRQLAQRITARYHLAALKADDTRAYIAHRLALAGGSAWLFTRAACNTVHRLASGIPRVINVIADRALLGAFVEGKGRVTAPIVRKAAREVSGRRVKQRWWLAAAATTIAAVGGAWMYLDLRAEDPTEVMAGVAASPAVTQPNSVIDPPMSAASGEESSVAATDRDTVGPDELQPSAELATVAMQNSGQVVRGTEPTPHPAVAAESIPTALRRPSDLTGPDTQRLAYAALFERWNKPFGTDDIPCNHAPQVGLQCLKQQGSWSDVLKLDRPAVLELWDDRSDPYYAAVLEARPETVRLQMGQTVTEVTPDDLPTAWFGTFVVLWSMPPNYRGNLQIGDSDPTVAWLRQRLASALGRDLGLASDVHFDQRLFDALVEFQRAHGLAPDGVAGPQTWIHLGSGSGQPTLAVAHAG